jgi:hypothetical protein
MRFLDATAGAVAKGCFPASFTVFIGFFCAGWGFPGPALACFSCCLRAAAEKERRVGCNELPNVDLPKVDLVPENCGLSFSLHSAEQEHRKVSGAKLHAAQIHFDARERASFWPCDIPRVPNPAAQPLGCSHSENAAQISQSGALRDYAPAA